MFAHEVCDNNDSCDCLEIRLPVAKVTIARRHVHTKYYVVCLQGEDCLQVSL